MKLRVASYNLHKGRGLTGPHAPERNLEVIAGMGADIVALQEVDRRFGTRVTMTGKLLLDEDRLRLGGATALCEGEVDGCGMTVQAVRR